MNRKLRIIPENEVQWLTPYQVDIAGRAFCWEGGIYRCITPRSQAFYHRLFADGGNELANEGVIPTEITDYSINECNLVLRHQRVPFVSYCVEWCPDMLRDAALMLCSLGEYLWRRNLTIWDPHPWNVLFDKGRPKLVDIGSLGAVDETIKWGYAGIRDFFWLPLLLLSCGKQRIARAMMLDVRHNWSRGDVFRLVVGRATAVNLVLQRRMDNRLLENCNKPTLCFFHQMCDLISATSIGIGNQTEWTGYHGVGERWQADKASEDAAKVASVEAVLSTINPRTVVDLGCNKGWFSLLAASHGADVVAIDLDEPSISDLYKKCKHASLSVAPVVMDLTRPTPVHGVAGAYPCAEMRFQSELAMSLATMHHLVLRQGLTFESLGRLFSGYAKQWLLLEFIPREDPHMKDMLRGDEAWYNKENLLRAFAPWFALDRELPSAPVPRTLLLFKRK